MQALGAVLGGMAVFYIAMALAQLRRQASNARARSSLALELMRQQVQAASLVRAQREGEQLCWNGYRKFRLSSTTEEAENVRSLCLVPHDGKPLPEFQPGQFLTIRFQIPGHDKAVVRCYTISSSPSRESYRITVKRTQDGLVSNFLHRELPDGSILDVQAPRGQFCLDPERPRPVVMIAGGVGVTPFVSMLESIAATKSGQQVTLINSVRRQREHAMRERLSTLAADNENINVVNVYTDPDEDDQLDKSCDLTGRINLDQLRSILPSNNFDFYLCGPPEMMEMLIGILAEWGVPDRNVFSEAFGAPSAQTIVADKVASKKTASDKVKKPAGKNGSIPQSKANVTQPKITFSKSKKSANWYDAASDILSVASENGVHIESGCSVGNCGTCQTALRSGNVRYAKEPAFLCEERTCLPCVAIPVADVVVDA